MSATKALDFTPVAQQHESYITELLYDTPTQPMHLFDILGVPKAHLLMALYNAAGVVDSHYSNDMSLYVATQIVEGYDGCGTVSPPMTNFTRRTPGGCAYGDVDEDGLFMGRFVNVDLSGNEMDVESYDRVNGDGTAFRATKTLLAAIGSGLITPAIVSGE